MFTIASLCHYFSLEVLGEREIDEKTIGYYLARNPGEDSYSQIELCFPKDYHFSEKDGYYDLRKHLKRLWDRRIDRGSDEQFAKLFSALDLGRFVLFLFQYASDFLGEVEVYEVKLLERKEELYSGHVLATCADDAISIALLDYNMNREEKRELFSCIREFMSYRDAIFSISSLQEDGLVYSEIVNEGRIYLNRDWTFLVKETKNVLMENSVRFLK